jgi:hypothetical protein
MPPRGRKPDAARRRAVAELRSQGLSFAEIGERHRLFHPPASLQPAPHTPRRRRSCGREARGQSPANG